MESTQLWKTLVSSQYDKMKETFADLPNHRSPPSTRYADIDAHIQAFNEIDYVLNAGRIARQKAYAKYKRQLHDQELYNKQLHDNAVHVLSTELLNIKPRNISPDIM